VYCDRSSEVEQLLIRPFSQKNEKYKCGEQMTFNINILCHGNNSKTIAPKTKKMFCTMKDSGHTYKFYFNNNFL
jgi:hypothetical protein